ncbi:MAG: FadR/GntR family transcriptional regulator [Galactobacter sp.]
MTSPEANAFPLLDAAVLLRPARSPNAFEDTVQRLLQSVRLGLIPPGARLPSERDLAAMLKVSRDTLREALAALSEAGYLQSRRGRYGGTFISTSLPAPTPVIDGDGELTPRVNIPTAEIEDTLTLRRVIEVGSAREVAARGLTSGEHTRLRRAKEACNTNPDDVRRLDARFHLLIVELVGAPSLLPLMADVRMRINELLDRIPLTQETRARSDHQHGEILQAIAKGEPDLAENLMRNHLAETEELLRGNLSA